MKKLQQLRRTNLITFSDLPYWEKEINSLPEERRRQWFQLLVGQLLFTAYCRKDPSLEVSAINYGRTYLSFSEEEVQEIKNLVIKASGLESITPIASKRTESNSAELGPVSPLHAKGQLMVEAWAAHGLKAELVTFSDKASRCDLFVFRKDVGVTFNSFSRYLSEVLSNAGYSADNTQPILLQPNNCFILQVPRPPAQWTPVDWFKYKEGESIREVVHRAKSTIDLQGCIPVGQKVDGSPMMLDPNNAAFIIGNSRSGKSNFVKIFLLGLSLLYSPNEALFLAWDFKMGLSFSHLCKLPHFISFTHNNMEDFRESVIDDVKSLQNMATQRGHLLYQHGLETLQEYKDRFPGDTSYPFIFLFVDEMRKAKDLLGKDLFMEAHVDAITQWQSLGIYFVEATQYPSAADSLPPSVRASYVNKIAFLTQDTGANLIFPAGSEGAKVTPNLLGQGDMYAHGLGRGQCLYIDNETLARVVDEICILYNRRKA